MTDFTSKVVVISGAAHGPCEATAKAFADSIDIYSMEGGGDA